MSKLNGLYFKLGKIVPYTLDNYIYNIDIGWNVTEDNIIIKPEKEFKMTNWNKTQIEELMTSFE